MIPRIMCLGCSVFVLSCGAHAYDAEEDYRSGGLESVRTVPGQVADKPKRPAKSVAVIALNMAVPAGDPGSAQGVAVSVAWTRRHGVAVPLVGLQGFGLFHSSDAQVTAFGANLGASVGSDHIRLNAAIRPSLYRLSYYDSSDLAVRVPIYIGVSWTTDRSEFPFSGADVGVLKDWSTSGAVLMFGIQLGL